ncbi:Dot/Icm T4SS effector MavF [Legionella pneumophila]
MQKIWLLCFYKLLLKKGLWRNIGMEDPFSVLLKSLQSVFHLEAMRNGKYTFPAVQHLREATENYNPKARNTFIELLRAIREALPYIEKWRINFNVIRKSMDALAKLHHMPTIDWNQVLSHPKVSPRFQFSALNHSHHEYDLMTWLEKKVGKPFTQLDHTELTQTLVDHRDRLGFSQKLSNHLKKDPDFLYNIILRSERNFIKISQTRLILYLTDEQLARAIIKHIPVLMHKRKAPFEQIEQLIHTLNEILSNGRSVSTLLRNTDAKTILENSPLFQMYLSEEYKNRHQHPNKNPDLQTKESLKPGL